MTNMRATVEMDRSSLPQAPPFTRPCLLGSPLHMFIGSRQEKKTTFSSEFQFRDLIKSSGSDRIDATVTDSRGPTRPHQALPFYTIHSPLPNYLRSSRTSSIALRSVIHGSVRRRSPPRLRRRGLRLRARAWPRPPDTDQADQGRRRLGGRRQQRVRVHGVRAHGVDLEGRDGRQHHAGADGGRQQRPAVQGPAVVGRAHVRGPLLLRARQPRHLQRPRALHGVRALPDEARLRRLRGPPRLVLQLRRGHRHGPAQGLRAAALHRRAVARHRRRAVQARGRRGPLLRRRRRRLRVRAAGRPREDTVHRPLRVIVCGW